MRVGEANDFAEAVSTVEDVVTADDTDVVFVASLHDSHADITDAGTRRRQARLLREAARHHE